MALRKSLGCVDLTLIGIGGIIGAGIYVLTGQAAARYAGPAVVLSFCIAAVSCAFAALCYSELAAIIPSAGSAYSFGTASLGPLIGFLLGWDLQLEYLFGAATVAVGWAGYFSSLLRDIGAPLPRALASAPFARDHAGAWHATGGALNLPAALIVVAATLLQVRGVKESARFNNAVVALKVGVLLLFLCAGFGFVRSANYTPFIPDARGPGEFGVGGVLRGSSVVFFSFIGFDAISTAASEAVHPQRDVPRATLVSLAVCTLLYVATARVITGLVPFSQLDVPDPIAVAVDALPPALLWLRAVVKVGALLGLTSVIMVLVMGQARIFFAMADDGLLPPVFARVHPVYHTPHVTTLATGALAAAVAALLPVDVLGEMVSIGTLAAFVVVCVGVVVLRRTRPALHRPFRVPGAPWVPALGAAVALLQILALPPETWLRLVAWMAAGLAVWFGYSKRRAKPWEERQPRLFGEPEAAAAAAEAPSPASGGEAAGGGAAVSGGWGEGGRLRLLAVPDGEATVQDGELGTPASPAALLK